LCIARRAAAAQRLRPMGRLRNCAPPSSHASPPSAHSRNRLLFLEIEEDAGEDECEACTAELCSAEFAACADTGNGTRCADVARCFEHSSCAAGATVDTAATIVLPCFCGTYEAVACAGGDGDGDGPCLAEARLAASGNCAGSCPQF
jgi:hypothetical protein